MGVCASRSEHVTDGDAGRHCDTSVAICTYQDDHANKDDVDVSMPSFLRFLRDNTVSGQFVSPFFAGDTDLPNQGNTPVIYADWTASGRALRCIERTVAT
ncbi:MAG: hypothetical protein MHM6MM_005751, partial [Cercozoa sp. M6MM]